MTEICEKCGVGTGGSNVKTVKADGTVTRVRCFDCDQKERLDTFGKDGILTGRLVMDAILGRADHGPLYEIKMASERLHERLKSFEQRVWFGGLQEVVRASSRSGMSMRSGNAQLLTFCSGGRCMITLQEDDVDFTAVADEDSPDPRTGTQSMTGREADIMDLFDRIEEAWAAGTRPVADAEVSMV